MGEAELMRRITELEQKNRELDEKILALSHELGIHRELQDLSMSVLRRGGVGVWEWSAGKGVVLTIIPETEPGFHHLKENIPYTKLDEIIEGEDLKRITRKALKNFRRGKLDFRDEVRIMEPDGNSHWVLVHGQVVGKNAAGHVIRVIGNILDIDRQKQVEERLRASEERWKHALEACNEAVFDLDNQRGYFISEQFLRTMGYTSADLPHLVNSLPEIVRPDKRGEFYQALMAHVNGETAMFFAEVPLRTATGDYKWILGKGKIIQRDQEGRPLRTIGTLVDVTEQKKMEAKLEISLERFRLLADNLSDLVTISLLETMELQYVSPSSKDLLGYEAEELVNSSAMRLMHPEDLPRVLNEFGQAYQRGERIISAEFRMQKKDGEYLWVEAVGRIIPTWKEGFGVQMVTSVRSIEERKQKEVEDVRKRERYEAIRLIDQQILSAQESGEFGEAICKTVRAFVGNDEVYLIDISSNLKGKIIAVDAAIDAGLLSGDELALGDIVRDIHTQISQTYIINLAEESFIESSVFFSKLREKGIKSALIEVLSMREMVIGGIILIDKREGYFNTEDKEFVQEAGAAVALGLHQTALIKELRGFIRWLENVRQANLDLMSDLDPSSVFNSIVKRATDLLQGDAGIIMLYNPVSDTLDIAAQIGTEGWNIPNSIDRNEGLSGFVFNTGQVQTVHQYDQWEGRIGVLESYPFQSIMGIPILWGAEKLGVIDIMFTKRNEEPAEQMAFMELFATQAAVAVNNARLFHSEREAHKLINDLYQYLQEARENERTMIAREIHDEFGQRLTTLKIYAAQIAKLLPAENRKGQEKIERMLALIDETVNLVRKTAQRLRPGVLDDLGLVAAIEWQASEFSRISGIEIELNLEFDEEISDNNISTGLFRILQEALTNVARHAKASDVTISLSDHDGLVVLSILDNGKGVDFAGLIPEESLGLLGMIERAEALGGELEISSQPGSGTNIQVRIPINRA